MVMGKGVARARDLGQIDMRVIAPTLEGRLLGSKPQAALDLAR